MSIGEVDSTEMLLPFYFLHILYMKHHIYYLVSKKVFFVKLEIHLINIWTLNFYIMYNAFNSNVGNHYKHININFIEHWKYILLIKG